MPSYNTIFSELDSLVNNLKSYPDRSGASALYVVNLCKQKLDELELALTGVADDKAMARYVFS